MNNGANALPEKTMPPNGTLCDAKGKKHNPQGGKPERREGLAEGKKGLPPFLPLCFFILSHIMLYCGMGF